MDKCENMRMKYLLSIDQGTTSSRAIVFDENQNIISESQKEYELQYPKDGWVEANPDEIDNSPPEHPTKDPYGKRLYDRLGRQERMYGRYQRKDEREA